MKSTSFVGNILPLTQIFGVFFWPFNCHVVIFWVFDSVLKIGNYRMNELINQLMTKLFRKNKNSKRKYLKKKYHQKKSDKGVSSVSGGSVINGATPSRYCIFQLCLQYSKDPYSNWSVKYSKVQDRPVFQSGTPGPGFARVAPTPPHTTWESSLPCIGQFVLHCFVQL